MNFTRHALENNHYIVNGDFMKPQESNKRTY